ncbi:hypothetical protein BPT24_288 [Tenacibaculum phage pT24]|uniref:Uncharacterized protein n=1 Tax=Tenacibaculum phage pT24 TaxID=1880590 RepID=A0A1B4XX74_9CAUD|nr:hypothetical protein HYP10_gp239 [Tenacibaculum phage pT24]BAV39406.1 hypothetical protein BPT24_288 [Tenacibaculum phage pT24]
MRNKEIFQKYNILKEIMDVQKHCRKIMNSVIPMNECKSIKFSMKNCQFELSYLIDNLKLSGKRMKPSTEILDAWIKCLKILNFLRNNRIKITKVKNYDDCVEYLTFSKTLIYKARSNSKLGSIDIYDIGYWSSHDDVKEFFNDCKISTTTNSVSFTHLKTLKGFRILFDCSEKVEVERLEEQIKIKVYEPKPNTDIDVS